jgi:hypothetical protein
LEDYNDNDNKEGQKGVKKRIMGWKGGKKSGINDGDNDDDNENNKEGRKGGKKWGDNNDDPSASMGSGSSLSSSDEVVMWVLFNLSNVN